jgi:hypothetical protein
MDFICLGGVRPFGAAFALPPARAPFEGAPAGTGAIYSWEGNNKVGAGRMTMTESRPHERIQIKLEFFRPFAALNTGELAFQPEGRETTVRWSMAGKHAFMMNAMGLFMSMDKMVGGQFEKGAGADEIGGGGWAQAVE